jgi:uronate dehydrogenase
MEQRNTSLRVLVTGAAGLIGRTLHGGIAGRYGLLRLLDVQPYAAAGPNEEFQRADLTDPHLAAQAVAGIDTVVHLAGIPGEDTWERIYPNNILAMFNLFEASRLAGVKRIIFASSNHVIGYYRANRDIDAALPVRPDSRYGVSKVFGEALGRLYADKHGIEVACLRIGSFRKRPENERQLATWLSPRDLVSLVQACIEAPRFDFVVLYGVSANTRNRWRNDPGSPVDFTPVDNAELYADEVERTQAGIAQLFHGGDYCADGFTGRLDDDER